jgi:hypothetical protein
MKHPAASLDPLRMPMSQHIIKTTDEMRSVSDTVQCRELGAAAHGARSHGDCPVSL